MCDGIGRIRAGGNGNKEVYVPTAPWRRRRVNDIPRPAGRRWAGRLRRGGTLARRVLVGPLTDSSAAPPGTDALIPAKTTRRRFTLRRGAAGRGGTAVAGRPGRSEPTPLATVDLTDLVPTSPPIPA